jgi:hypothetical protein
LDYANDIALITNTAEQANQMLHAVETECRKVGLLINTKKTGDGRKYIKLTDHFSQWLNSGRS